MPMKNDSYKAPRFAGPEDREFDEHLVEHLKEFSALSKQLRAGVSGAAKGEAMNKYNTLRKRLLGHTGRPSEAD